MGREERERLAMLAQLQAKHPYWFRVMRVAAIMRLFFTAPFETITMAERCALWALIFYTLGRFIF